jgi:hypothetical protein
MELKHRTQLPELLKYFKLPLTAIEIGVAEGYNSFDLLKNGIEKLYMVDNWGTIDGITGDGNFPQQWHDKNYSDAMKRVSAFSEKVTVLRGLSQLMCDLVEDDSVSLLYLDGDHSYEGVMRDLRLWYPKVVKGGIIAGHDYLNKSYGVNKAVSDFMWDVSCGRDNNCEPMLIPEDNECDAGFWFVKG